MSLNHNENKIGRGSSNTERKRRSGKETSANRQTARKSGSTERDKIRAGIENFSTDKTVDRDTYFDKYLNDGGRTVASAPKSSKGNIGTKRGTQGTNYDSAQRKSTRSPAQKRLKDNETAEPPTKIKEYTVKQRKIRTMLFYIGLFLVIVVSAVVLSVTIVFKTDNIIVVGDDIPYSTQDIIDKSGLSYGENIFLSRKKAAAKNIVDAFPYIESAEVTVKIPGTQVITVEGAIPSYEVAVNGGYAVISSNGRVLEHIGYATGTVPLIKGVKVTDTEIGEYIQFEKDTTRQILSDVIECINSDEIPNIYGIDISNSADIKLNYDNRITISLGVPEDVSYKLRTAMAIINGQLSSTDKGDLDVSLANSDRKASYFTPIYSNTITIEDSVSSNSSDTVSNSASSDDSRNGDETADMDSSEIFVDEDEVESLMDNVFVDEDETVESDVGN